MWEKYRHLWIVVVLVNLPESQEINRRDILNRILNDAVYDPRIPPNFEEDKATNVRVQLEILNIDSFNEISMDYSLNIFLRQTWIDPRLNISLLSNIPSLELDQKRIEDVWVPDTYFRNEESATFHKVTVPNKLLHINNNGLVTYSLRLSLTLSCNMDLHAYPMDDQTCSVVMESYGYSIDNVQLVWNPNVDVIMPATPDDKQTLPQFYFHKPVETDECSRVNSFNVTFSCLETKLFFRRNLGYYMSQVFIPSMLVVMLSWLSFWMHVEEVASRTSLGVICVLTMTTQNSGLGNPLPRVSYVKAIDVWMAFGQIFVFAALLEYAYVNIQTRKYHKLTEERMTTDSESAADLMKRARLVDIVSRIAFPGAYVFFNIVFWSVYLSK